MSAEKFNFQQSTGAIFSFLLLFSLFLAGQANAYTDTKFSMDLYLSPTYSHVVEKSTFSLDTDEERQTFANSLQLGKTTIADWKSYSRNIDYHVGSIVLSNSTRVLAKRDLTALFPTAVVVVEYDIDTSILQLVDQSTRVTHYKLDSSKLALPKLRSNEIVLGSGATFSIEVPSTMRFEKVLPQPESRTPTKLIFQGPLASNLEITLIDEKTLGDEVSEFFTRTTSNATSFVPLLFGLAIIAFIAYKLVSGRE